MYMDIDMYTCTCIWWKHVICFFARLPIGWIQSGGADHPGTPTCQARFILVPCTTQTSFRDVFRWDEGCSWADPSKQIWQWETGRPLKWPQNGKNIHDIPWLLTHPWKWISCFLVTFERGQFPVAMLVSASMASVVQVSPASELA